ncbi:MAG: outer membrane beta-barrel protein [Bacteroidota bacterium]
MREDTFDRIIQGRLQSHEVPFVPDDWEILAEKLQEASGPHEAGVSTPVFESFDDAIRAKFDSFAVEESPSTHWKELSEKMYGAFDTSIEDTLSSYEVPYDPANWEAMVEHLEKPFYHLFQQRLGQFKVPLMRQDWKQMRQVLEKELPAPAPKVYERWEVFAVAASLAFLLLFLPRFQSIDTPVGPIDIVSEETQAVEDNSTSETGDTETLSPMKEDNISSQKVPLLAEAESKNFVESPANNNSQAMDIPQDLSSGNAESNSIPPAEIVKKLEALPPTLINNDLHPEKLPVIAFEQKERFEPFEEPSVIIPVSTVSSDISKEIDFIPTEAVELATSRNRISPEFLIGVYSGNTSSRVELNDKGGQGFSGGVRVEVKFTDLLSVVSGLQYAEKRFSHQFSISQTLDNASGPTRTSQVLEAEFSTIELPTLVRLRLPSDEKNSLYVQTGIVSFVMVSESYKRFDPTSPQNTELISNGGGVVTNPTENLKHTDHKLSLTTYVANFHAAIGWEYKISQGLLLQLEPYFQMGLQDMRPPGASPAEENKLYTGGIGASLFFDLNQKAKKSKTSPSKLF